MDSQDHVSEQDLASLAEGSLVAEREPVVRAHVARCRRCLAAYAEAARYRVFLLDRPEGVRASDAMIALGATVEGRETEPGPEPSAPPDPGRAWVHPPGPADRVRKVQPPRRRALAGALGLAAAGVAVLAFALLPRGSTRLPGLGDADGEALRSAAVRVSGGEMMLPGVEHDLGGELATGRSLMPSDSQQLESTISVLARQLHEDRLTKEGAYWLGVAYLAAGRSDAARKTTDASRARFPGDARLATLDAVIAYHESDFARAEEGLRRALAASPQDALGLFNLGFLLCETGRTAEARPLLEKARDSAASPAVVERAEAILRRLP